MWRWLFGRRGSAGDRPPGSRVRIERSAPDSPPEPEIYIPREKPRFSSPVLRRPDYSGVRRCQPRFERPIAYDDPRDGWWDGRSAAMYLQDSLWVLCRGVLRQFDLQGQPLQEVALPAEWRQAWIVTVIDETRLLMHAPFLWGIWSPPDRFLRLAGSECLPNAATQAVGWVEEQPVIFLEERCPSPYDSQDGGIRQHVVTLDLDRLQFTLPADPTLGGRLRRLRSSQSGWFSEGWLMGHGSQASQVSWRIPTFFSAPKTDDPGELCRTGKSWWHSLIFDGDPLLRAVARLRAYPVLPAENLPQRSRLNATLRDGRALGLAFYADRLQVLYWEDPDLRAMDCPCGAELHHRQVLCPHCGERVPDNGIR
ncbi:MAG: hypothetical protein AB1758_17255 [Candidatus Eremiobacterota bacterium]